MKDWKCNGCGTKVMVVDDWEDEFCCRGLIDQCGCGGMPINPVFCDECEKKFFGGVEE